MTPSTTDVKNHRSVLALILYVLGGLAALAGLIALASVLGAAASLQSNLFLLRATFGPLVDLFGRGIQSAVQFAGVLIFVILLAVGSLLFVAGKLTARQVTLAERVARLERRLAEQ